MKDDAGRGVDAHVPCAVDDGDEADEPLLGHVKNSGR